MWRSKVMAGLGAATVLLATETVFAQGIPTPPPVQDSQTGGALANRRPGLLVQAGIVRANEFTDQVFAGSPDVVDTIEDRQTPKQAALAESIRIVFENLNLLLVGLNNMIRANAGLAPQLPGSLTSRGITSTSSFADRMFEIFDR